MRDFYFKDKKTNVAFHGILPHDDLDWPPLDFYRYAQAEVAARNFSEILKVKCPIPVPMKAIRLFVLSETDKMIAEMLRKTNGKPEIHKLFTDDSLSYKEQNQLLKNLELNEYDLLWLNKEAQDLGYLLDIYHEEKYPDKFNEKRLPVVINQKVDGTIEKIGSTDMTLGEMRALIEQRKVIQARIFHKDNNWHCFYSTYKGLSGEESGVLGSKPHYHYLSDKSGILWEELIERIKICDMPSSKVHIIISR